MIIQFVDAVQEGMKNGGCQFGDGVIMDVSNRMLHVYRGTFQSIYVRYRCLFD